MAQKKGTTTKKSTASKTASRKPAKTSKASEEKSRFSDYFHAFSKSRFFAPVVMIIVILAVFGIDLLISLNKYDRFFKILGIEILIAAVILVIMLALSSNKPDTEDKTDKEKEEYAP
ncbi:MAG: hypothetical protein K6F83_03430 [Clostridiales bacterium]|nr:hypothetical protein [Clostridiales bacterium]